MKEFYKIKLQFEIFDEWRQFREKNLLLVMLEIIIQWEDLFFNV